MAGEFEFHLRTKVCYGAGRSERIAEDVKALGCGDRVVLVTDPGLVRLGLADSIASSLRSGGLEVVMFDGVQSDPTAASIDAAADLIRAADAGCVVGLGGGSAMDVAKMASLVAGAEHPAEHYALLANPFARRQAATVMIPTTSGTGAEVTSTVVFTNAAGRKVWGWDPQLVPDLAVLDPRLTAALPETLTAATGLDALVHAIEATAGRRSQPMVRAVGLQAIRLISENLPRALERPDDLDARGALCIGAMLAGLAIEQGGTGLAHCIGHALGTLARVHHGRAVAIALYHCYNWNIIGHERIHAEIARAMGAAPSGGGTDEDWAYAGAECFRRLVTDTGLNLNLEGDGLSAADAPRFAEVMASPENAPMRNNNCRYAEDEDLARFAGAILGVAATV